MRQLHLGYKLAHTARPYTMTVNNQHIISNTIKGHMVCFNDKTLVHFGDFINKLHNGKCTNK